MGIQKQSVNVSIFYGMSGWHLLLQQIQSIAYHLKEQHLLESYAVSLNFRRGENIRFSGRVLPGNDVLLATETERLALAFLHQFHSVSHVPPYPVEGFLMNFPNNSVQYNLFKPVTEFTERPLAPFQADCQEALSKHLVSILSEEEVTNDTIFSFGLYAFLGIFSGCSSNISEAISLVNLFNNASRWVSAGKSMADEIFQANREPLLEEYTLHLLETTTTPPHWMSQWRDYTRAQTAIVKSDPELDVDTYMRTMLDAVQHQLALTNDTVSIICDISRNILTELKNSVPLAV